MPLVVGVSFKKVGKVYYFDPVGLDLHEGDFVIAETARGMEFCEVMMEPKEVPEEEIVPPLKKVIRKATNSDVEREETNRQREKNAYSICLEKIHSHNLPMKLIDAEYCFDGSQVTFYFSADSRVDFRELVKDLAGALRTKVQLHQVGVRDEAKLFGGLGPCGRVMCCSSFLSGFDPVSMKMAKEQSLFLNPLKFSGICGKLMCCLKFEYHMYKEVKSRLPAVGSIIPTPNGPGKVIELDVMKEMLGILMENGNVLHCTMEELTASEEKPKCPAAENGCGGCGAHHAIEEQMDPQQQSLSPQMQNGGRETDGEAKTSSGSKPGGNAQKADNSRRRPGRQRDNANKPNTTNGGSKTANGAEKMENGDQKRRGQSGRRPRRGNRNRSNQPPGDSGGQA